MSVNSYLFICVAVLALTSGVRPALYYNITTKGAQCAFPFFYNGTTYTDCVNAPGGSKPWCSTAENCTREEQWGECLDYDVCLSHWTLSDPWRNTDFNITSFPGWPMNDLYLQEGWYKFTGISGDHMVYNCLTLSELLNNPIGSSSVSSADFSFYTCEMVIDSPKNLDCGRGLVLYYLVPTNGMYLTRHSICNASSCGPSAQCNPHGGCDCVPGNLTPVGFLKSRQSYTCTDFIPPVREDCKDHCSEECALDLLRQIQDRPDQVMSKDVVAEYLKEEMNCVRVLEHGSPQKMLFHGNLILKSTKKLVSGLVKFTFTYYPISIAFNSLEVEVFVVGPNASLTEIPQLNTSSAYLDIDLIGISQDNNGHAAVALVSYAYLSNILNPSFSNKRDGTDKIIVSTVASVILFNINSKQLSKPFNITLKNTTELDPEGRLSCMTWKDTKWVADVCSIISTNRTHTVCSSHYPGTFALIMQINCSSKVPSDYADIINVVAMAVGLGFLVLTLLTFALCRQHLKVNSVAQVNLTLSLLLAHLLFLLTQKFLQKIQASRMICTVLAGVLHFLFLSAFVWMLIDAVLLFISAKNLTKIQSSKKEVLGWRCLIVIGYVIPLLLVGVSAGLVPHGYGSEQCWIKMDKGFLWSFLGPVSFILASNLILYGAILIMVIFTLKSLNNEILQRKNTLADRKLIKSVMFKTGVQFFILGCPWILGFFTCNSDVLEILFLVFNSQQGTFIFLIHCVLNKEIREQFRKWSSTFCPSKKPHAMNNVQREQREAEQIHTEITK